jgi:hypothetical protein
VFIRGTNTKQLEVPKIAGRNTKANVFQKGRAGFKATMIMMIMMIIIIITAQNICYKDVLKCKL